MTYINQSTQTDWDREKQIAIAASNVALLTSGTVSLEVAAADTAQVVAYKANPSTEKMMKKMALIDTATLVNLLTETRDVPEFLFEDATPVNIATALDDLLRHGGSTPQLETARKAMMLLMPPHIHAAARSVIRFVEENPAT